MPTYISTSLALLAFAANSILCRMALGDKLLDPASFTSIRLLSGAIMLYLLVSIHPRQHTCSPTPLPSRITAALMLFIYASTFSFGYVSLNTGTGAVILFAAVQMTMMAASIIKGKHPPMQAWLGMAFAFSGFVYLMLPDANMPSLSGFLWMSLAGIAWGIYSMLGQQSQAPLFDTQRNFLYALPFTLLLSAWLIHQSQLSNHGILLAIISGALASSLGYVFWYAALRNLPTSLAAVLQILVPILATLGGVFWLNESISSRFIIAAPIILSGIFILSKAKL